MISQQRCLHNLFFLKKKRINRIEAIFICWNFNTICNNKENHALKRLGNKILYKCGEAITALKLIIKKGAREAKEESALFPWILEWCGWKREMILLDIVMLVKTQQHVLDVDTSVGRRKSGVHVAWHYANGKYETTKPAVDHSWLHFRCIRRKTKRIRQLNADLNWLKIICYS